MFSLEPVSQSTSFKEAPPLPNFIIVGGVHLPYFPILLSIKLAEIVRTLEDNFC